MGDEVGRLIRNLCRVHRITHQGSVDRRVPLADRHAERQERDDFAIRGQPQLGNLREAVEEDLRAAVRVGHDHHQAVVVGHDAGGSAIDRHHVDKRGGATGCPGAVKDIAEASNAGVGPCAQLDLQDPDIGQKLVTRTVWGVTINPNHRGGATQGNAGRFDRGVCWHEWPLAVLGSGPISSP